MATALSATVQDAFSTVSTKLEASAAQHATTQQAQNVRLEALAASLQVREGWKGGEIRDKRYDPLLCLAAESIPDWFTIWRRFVRQLIDFHSVHVPNSVCVQDHLQRSQKEMVEGVQAMLLTACANHESLVYPTHSLGSDSETSDITCLATCPPPPAKPSLIDQ